MKKYNTDDPKLTAYALGELDETERAAIETQLAEDETSRKFVEDVRASAAELSCALGGEAQVGLAQSQREEIIEHSRSGRAMSATEHAVVGRGENPMFKLIFHTGSLGGNSMDVVTGRVVIGRTKDCDICLNDDGVSRRHCALEKRESGIYVCDLGATNPVRINGRRMHEMEQQLESGDEVQVGPVRFTFEMPEVAVEMVGQASSLSPSLSSSPQPKWWNYPLPFLRSTWGAILVGVIVALLIALPFLILLPELRRTTQNTDDTEQPFRNTFANNADFLRTPSIPSIDRGQPQRPLGNDQEPPHLNDPDPPRVPAPDSVEEVKSWIGVYLRDKTGNADVTVRVPDDPQESAWYIRQYHLAGNDPAKVYWVVREQMATANELLGMTDVAFQRRGLGMALEAATRVMRLLKDRSLATAICDAYVLPNIEFADERNSESLNKENVLMGAIRIYHLAKDCKRQAVAYKLLIKHAPDKHVAGLARMRLAEFHRKGGQFEEAVNNLKEIAPDSSVAGARRLIPLVQKQLEQQNKQQAKWD